MPYTIAGIDVHKRMLAVVVSDVAVEGEFQFARRTVGTSPDQLRALAAWLVDCEVEEVVMESTAQYWRPVWEALERYWQPRRRTREGAGAMSGALHLAQAQSNRGASGRKKDFPDAERLVKRLVAQELTLSFVPDTEQRLWRDGDAPQVPAHVQPGATAESAGVPAGGSAHQGVQPRVGSVRGECPADVAGRGRWRNEPRRGRGARQSAPARHS